MKTVSTWILLFKKLIYVMFKILYVNMNTKVMLIIHYNVINIVF